jgi:hypothetical protein
MYDLMLSNGRVADNLSPLKLSPWSPSSIYGE